MITFYFIQAFRISNHGWVDLSLQDIKEYAWLSLTYTLIRFWIVGQFGSSHDIGMIIALNVLKIIHNSTIYIWSWLEEVILMGPAGKRKKNIAIKYFIC